MCGKDREGHQSELLFQIRLSSVSVHAGVFASVFRRAWRAAWSRSSGSVGGKGDDLVSSGAKTWGFEGMLFVLSCTKQALKGETRGQQ